MMGKRMWGVLALLAVTWLIAMAAIPGRFPHIDEGYFKEPGYTLMKEGRLASPAFGGYWRLTPDLAEVFAAYQPLYPVAYSLWVHVFPHKFRYAVLFDALIRIGLVFCVALLVPRLLGGLKSGWSAAMGVFFLLWLGTVGRPDELAMIFGYAGLWFLMGADASLLKGAAAGFLLGLCGGTSLPVVLLLGILAGSVVVWDWKDASSAQRWCRVKAYIACSIAGGVALLSVLAPVYLQPGAWQQYRAISRPVFLGALRNSLESGSLASYVPFLVSAGRSLSFAVPLHCLVFSACIWIAWKSRAVRRRAVATGICVAYLATVVLFPQQYLYNWFLLPIGIILVGDYAMRCRVTGIVWCTALLLAANTQMREMVKAAALPDGQKEQAVVECLSKYIPPGSSVLGAYDTYFPLVAVHARAHMECGDVSAILRKADYCIHGIRAAGAGAERAIPAFVTEQSDREILQKEFEIVWESLPVGLPCLLGVPIGSQPAGYGVVVYRRRGE